MAEQSNVIKKISLNTVLDEREDQNGDFENVANLSQSFKDVFKSGKNYSELDNMQKESIEMILHKISRICSGNPDLKDHWIDIAGYAQLVAERIK